jgi:acyl carrier protein
VDRPAILSDVLDIVVKRLRFDERRLAGVGPQTPLAKGLDGALGLDSLDFIELSIALEERFGLVVEEGADVATHFATLGTLVEYIASRAGRPGP